MNKIGLALIVKGVDEEADVLSKCLNSVASNVDGIFITITHKKGEKVNERVKGVAELYGATISEFEWVNDFSKARNFNFSQVPKEYDYIFWLDADDAVRGVDMLRDTIEEHPADVYSMFYLYAFDEYKNPTVVHHKTRLVKNDGCVEWAGALHEDFKENRQLIRHHIDGIEVLHLSNEERFGAAKERNLEVAFHQMDESPNDPRSFWNVGNASKALGKNKEALENFSRFLELSQSDDEKYIVRLRMAESNWAMGKKGVGIEDAQYAIGLKPEYPDAYHLLGSLFLETGQYEKARDMFLIGLTKKPPYYEIIVYNPRDYDYQPLINLAKVYFQLNLPTLALECLKGCAKIQPQDESLKKTIKHMEKEADKFNKVTKIIKRLSKMKDKEKLKKEIDKVPDELQSHPGICNLKNLNFIKEESTGKDLVIMCGYTEREWDSDTAKTEGIGGSEEAVIHLSEGLIERGWNVTVYNNCGYKEKEINGVWYKPFWSWNYRDKQDVTILWRSPRLADYEINSSKIYIDVHDVIKEGEFNEKRLEKIDGIFVKSKFHRDLFPNIPDDKFTIVSNGIDSELFKQDLERDQYLMINTSSPDRSLSALVKGFKEVKKRVPQAKCKWAYGWGVFDIVHGDNAQVMEWKANIVKEMEEAGIETLGMIPHQEVAKLYLTAGILAYPSEFAEIDCISLSKAMASGAYPVTSDFSAVGERKNFGGTYIHSEKTADTWCPPYKYDFSLDDEKIPEWVNAVVSQLETPADTFEMREWAQKTYDWEKIINIWEDKINV